MDTAMATAIYTGILTDTGSFRFSNTNQAAFSICETMVAAGGEAVPGGPACIRYLFPWPDQTAQPCAGFHRDIQQRAAFHHDGYPGDACGYRHPAEDADGLINYARRIQDVKVAALIHELENGKDTTDDRKRFHVSLRSDGSVDVSRIAMGFGGGGHAGAAGFSLESNLVGFEADHF
jgi:phosphoesterase RecJ-like protein